MEPGQEIILAHGGRGGKGNMHFANSVRQAPNFARSGEPGETYDLVVELKLLADVGLIGFPNVGKSTLLSVISAARPKIADYPFTTIEPNLGVVVVDDYSFVVADIPGLIEGASLGQGLGHDFLRHIERTRLLIHVLDASGAEGRDPLADFDQINQELATFNLLLASRPQIIALNKIDDTPAEKLEHLKNNLNDRGYAVFPICAPIGDGVGALMKKTAEMVRSLPETLLTEPITDETIYRFEEEALFQIEREDKAFIVTGNWIAGLVASTNFDDTESLQYFQRLLRKKGVIAALEKAGVVEGDLIRLNEAEFEFIF
jgi:GTP-binding protein